MLFNMDIAMTQQSTEVTVDSLIEETLQLEPDQYDDDTRLEELDIDSLLVVELAEIIHIELGVEITDDALDEEIDNFGDLKQYIAERRD